MNLPQARRAFHFRWILAVGWAMVMLIYLDWLFHPTYSRFTLLFLHASWFADVGLKTVTGLDWIDSSETGLSDVLAFDNWGAAPPVSTTYALRAIPLFLIGVLAVWAFVAAEQGEQIILPAKRQPTWRTVAAAALMAALLTLGIETVLFQQAGLWVDLVRFCDHILPLRLQAESLFRVRFRWPGSLTVPPWVYEESAWRPIVPMFLLEWATWYVVLKRTWLQGQRYWQLESMTRGLLLAGVALWIGLSILGAIRPEGRFGYTPREIGSLYASKAIAVSVILWAWTCRLILLFQLRKFERQTDENICFACGYDLRASPGACPECGTARLSASKG